jgi:hypothetical protein
MLGENYKEIHDKYLHTLGNLSATGYNSEYQNAEYSVKQKKLNEYCSPIRILNEEMYSSSVWNEDIISQRANRLSEIILKIFPAPSNIDTLIKFETQTVYTLAELIDIDFKLDDDNIKAVSYKFLNSEVKVK